jgi:hypothetical protein
MLTVPSFILRRLYVTGSLRNFNEGFQFEIRNKFGSGHAKKLFPLTVDGQPIFIESCSFSVDGVAYPFQGVSNDLTSTIGLNKSTSIVVHDGLSEGPQKIDMSFEVAGLGVLKLHFTDVVTDGGYG